MQNSNANITPEDIQSTKGLACLSYLGILFLIPMFVNKNSAYTRYHVNQGIVLFIFDIAVLVVASIIGFIVTFTGLTLLSFIVTLLYILQIVLIIMGIVNAVSGKVKPLPIIGGITILK